MREVPFVRKANDLALATSHLAQSSSSPRFTAGCAGFFILSRSGERPLGRSPPGPQRVLSLGRTTRSSRRDQMTACIRRREFMTLLGGAAADESPAAGSRPTNLLGIVSVMTQP
jgi:hypothetical protein